MSTGGNQREWTGAVFWPRAARPSGRSPSVAPRGPAARRPPRVRAYAPFRMGLQSYSLRGYRSGGRPDVDKALAVTKELGIHNWEAYPEHIPMTADPQQIAEWKHRLESDGVTLMGYGVVHLGKDEAADRRSFEFARAMGLKYLSASPDPGSFDLLDKLVAEYGVAVGIHNHGPGDHFAKIETIEKAIKDHHHLIGCCVDTGHFLRSREDPVRAVEVFGKRVYGVHLKDVKDARTFTILGQGDLRTVDLLKALAPTTTNTAWRSSTRRSRKTPSMTSRPASPRPVRPSPRYGRGEKPGPGPLAPPEGRRGPVHPLVCPRRRAGDRYTVAAWSGGSTGGGVSRHGDRTRQGVGRGRRSRRRGQVRRWTDVTGPLVAPAGAPRHARHRARIWRTWRHVSPGRRDARSGDRYRCRRG